MRHFYSSQGRRIRVEMNDKGEESMKEKGRKQGNEVFRVIGSVTHLVEEVLRLER